VTGVPVDEGPVTLPVKVMPEESALLIVLLANKLMVRALVKAVLVETFKVPPLRFRVPELPPKLASEPTDKVPPFIVVPPL